MLSALSYICFVHHPNLTCYVALYPCHFAFHHAHHAHHVVRATSSHALGFPLLPLVFLRRRHPGGQLLPAPSPPCSHHGRPKQVLITRVGASPASPPTTPSTAAPPRVRSDADPSPRTPSPTSSSSPSTSSSQIRAFAKSLYFPCILYIKPRDNAHAARVFFPDVVFFDNKQARSQSVPRPTQSSSSTTSSSPVFSAARTSAICGSPSRLRCFSDPPCQRNRAPRELLSQTPPFPFQIRACRRHSGRDCARPP